LIYTITAAEAAIGLAYRTFVVLTDRRQEMTDPKKKYDMTVPAKDMTFYVAIGNNSGNTNFSNNLILAICWEETRFSNIPQVNGPAVGFGQLQKEGLNKAHQHHSRNAHAVGPGIFHPAAVLASEPISVSAISHCLAGYYNDFKTSRKLNALKAYAGGFASAQNPNAATNAQIVPRWLECEAQLAKLGPDPYKQPNEFMSALNLSLSSTQRLPSSGALYEHVRSRLFPDLYAQPDYQINWRWCNKCQGLFFGANTNQGVCPKGGAHSSIGSGNYGLAHGDGPGQAGWRWCMKCQGFWFAGNASPSICPAGSTHTSSGSGQYFAQPANGQGQSNWRWCRVCSGMFFAGNGTRGVCPGNKLRGHDPSGSGDYGLSKT
jgi:hypothetical protein